NASFADIATFIRQNPHWPGLGSIVAMAEQKMPAEADDTTVIRWFSAHPPQSLVGFYRYVDALSAEGKAATVAKLVHQRWVNGDFDADELSAFYGRFGDLIGRDDIWARLDRLLWSGDTADAKKLFGLADDGMKAVARARLALAANAPNADALYADVPDSWRHDPGLLFERLRWLRRQQRDDDAIAMLGREPSDLTHPGLWWNERAILAYRLMDDGDYKRAYRLADDNGQIDGPPFMEAEFLSGWLALRFLDRPQAAHTHFAALYANATTPISLARGAYWLGRAFEADGDKEDAESYYEKAAAFDTTFYGQLAAVRIEKRPVITIKAPAQPSAAARRAFYGREFVLAAERLHGIGQHDRAAAFFRAEIGQANNHGDFVLLTELASKIGRPDLMIAAARAANEHNMPVQADGFPLLQCRMPKQPDPAFTHALIRQESMFNPKAESAAGAIGLMQLMPHTAAAIAREIGLRFHATRLENPSYNIKLGTTFIENQIKSFDGSYILALAGYNAGPSRVRGWLDQIGDPRDPHVDPIDWIEMIPVAETRNYIQRVLEGLQIYRARLHGGHAPLMILKDLKR
ncbi:MAG TPA: lytic transglycosylase domain-containing protein, partial [Alphaproteobacteria bacterium]|nr:lytic transglycosylase domain-containing protein [Alphaproteobacteria bacterium]